MTAETFDDSWLARIEDAGINASAPREQRWVDGWLVRLAPGKAKRARSIQPVAPGRLGIDEKLAICLPLFAAAGLPPIVRVTPFSAPARLDDHLARLGMARFDDSLVMALPSLEAIAVADEASALAGAGSTLATIDARSFADWVGAARGSSPREVAAHADRIAEAPVPHRAVVARDRDGAVVCGGQVAVEGSLAGLYDIFTLAEAAPADSPKRCAAVSSATRDGSVRLRATCRSTPATRARGACTGGSDSATPTPTTTARPRRRPDSS